MNTELKLQMVGTGSAFGKRYHNNSCLVYAPDYTLLIDCGATVPLGLHELGVNVDVIDGIFITHIHGDHVNGLEELAWKFRYVHKKKIDLIGETELLKELWENSLKGGLRWATEGEIKGLEDLFNVIPIPVDPKTHASQQFDVSESLALDFFRTPHIPQKNSYSVIINNEIFYSGDVRFDPQLIYHVDVERKCNILFHDCQLHDLSNVHASISQLMTLPPEVQEKIWLMHYNDNMTDFIGETEQMEFLEQGTIYIYKNGTLYAGK